LICIKKNEEKRDVLDLKAYQFIEIGVDVEES